MLKVVPMSKPAEQERVCLISGLSYDKSQFSYAVYEDEKVCGAAQFYIKENIGYISDLRIVDESDTEKTMLLGRSVLNFLDLHGIEEVYFEKDGEYYNKAAKIIGFRDKNGKKYAYLPGMFTSKVH